MSFAKTKSQVRLGDLKPTEASLRTVQNNILPYEGLGGFRIKSIDVFWYKLFSDSRDNSDANLLRSRSVDLEECRPPDGRGLLSQSLCHMGILLESWPEDQERSNSPGLFVALELMSDGIHLSHEFGLSGTKEDLAKHRCESQSVFPFSQKRSGSISVKYFFIPSFPRSFLLPTAAVL